MSTSSDPPLHDIHRLLRDAVNELNLVCHESVHDPYQCYHWNTIGALAQTIEKLNACLEAVERRFGPLMQDDPQLTSEQLERDYPWLVDPTRLSS
jgi:hypothetical protein